MGLFSLILFVLAILLFSQQFICANTSSVPTGIYDAPRCKVRKCLTSSGNVNGKLGCEKNTMMRCFNDYEVFESLIGGKRVLCDTKTDGGGWTLIQRRINGRESFERNWADYKAGFGSLDGDFWMGNDFISQLTYAGYTELRIDMKYQGRSYYMVYENLLVKNEAAKYQISFNFKEGNTQDHLSYHLNMPFTTFDRENDFWSRGNCAVRRRSGYWFRFCFETNLNGVWGLTDYYGQGIVWNSVTGAFESLSFAEMKVRRP